MIPRPHSYEALIDRWHLLAARLKWEVVELETSDDHPVLALENSTSRRENAGGLYLSAGVHGDECAAAWGLLQWAESLSETDPLLSELPILILPCLNPHGFVENTRLDSDGNDLNRNFQNADLALVQSWQTLLANRKFAAAANLHEDYDSSGIYLYELSRKESIGHALLDACESLIPRESSSEIDGAAMTRGLLNRSEKVEEIVEEELGGWPEAIYLFLKHETDSFTFETPSELDLELRISTHRRFVETLVDSIRR